MTTLPTLSTVPVPETRSAEPVGVAAVAPASTPAASPDAAAPVDFAAALLAAVLPVPSPASPALGAASPAATTDAGPDGEHHHSEQEQTATALPAVPVTPLSLVLPPFPLTAPLPSANLSALPGLAGVAAGSVPASARDSLAPAATTVPALLADGQSPVAAGLPLGMTVPDGSTLAQAGSPAPSPLPGWFVHAQGVEPRAALPEWAPVALPADQPARWGESLRAALGERLAVQSTHGMDRALIRLDPPAFGSLEIAIRHEAGALTVQLVASHGEVVRQLQAIGDALRQDLSARQYTQVAVEVREGAPGGGQGQGQSQSRSGREGQQNERAPGRALAEAGGDGSAPFALA
ncbi:flagellar hook-length control protein FliK [Pseudogulbenkiania subflava]|uniref:Flagellar hook-length control protein FliK n=1 Tax=Pseudogulbenkiania subflava DSM 22618 TaxID=1123014 RepID=A0A1Y6BE76_9NEIS|nr:flagellar hook-length control protein FliK [Pseudogulbenkiania subflava]SMF06929.1 flagellar hook-length control protein FliK [Pseudogulbenkiania subflava DSM 22618]